MSSGRVLVITGPTATGKTALGVELCKELCGEVVSADSMQLYKGMDIGTAKVTSSEMQGVAHHMIDVAEPWESYSVARYVSEADACVQDILSRGRLPVIVGGTGLYIDSLVRGIDFNDNASDEALRHSLEEEYENAGGEEMLRRLSAFDPERAARLHPADKKRILRAMEVYRLTGITITEHDARTRVLPPRYDCVKIALSYENREELYARIDQRVELMAQAGLFDEVRTLLESGLSDSCTAMQGIGYKEAAAALRGELSREDALDLIKRESRRYAKRQLTWLRRDTEVKWIMWKEKPDFAYARQLSTAFFMHRK